MANKDLFKQAIADAKSIREAAIANAKLALEETITPELQSLLAAKLQEMEEADEEEENVEEAVEETVEETVEEAVEEEVSEEVEEVVAEADEEEDEAEDDSEESEDEADEEEADSEELDGDMEIADSDLTVDDIKDLIHDILSQELEGGEPGEEEDVMDDEMEDMEAQGEEAPDMTGANDDEIDINELLAELAEMEKDTEEEAVEETVEEEVVAEEEAIDESFTDLAMQLRDSGLVEPENAMTAAKALVAGGSAAVAAVGGLVAALRDKMGKKDSAEDLDEALETIETLRADLNETNLLNAKLLYVNKVFKANNLTESQKANVIAAFDKAETVKEVKLVFETVSENVVTKKEVVKETKGFASAATGIAPAKPAVISEANDVVRRMQKLAGIIK